MLFIVTFSPGVFQRHLLQFGSEKCYWQFEPKIESELATASLLAGTIPFLVTSDGAAGHRREDLEVTAAYLYKSITSRKHVAKVNTMTLGIFINVVIKERDMSWPV